MARVLVFDVNETLLDLRALDPQFERMFGSSEARSHWFNLVLRTAMTLSTTGTYRDFVSVGAAALQMVAAERGVDLRDEDRAAVAQTMTRLPPHPDVRDGMARLASHGFRIAALTNSPQDAAEQQLAAAGIADHFDRIMSVAPARRFKPAPEVYRMAEAELGESSRTITMVAAHDWDIAGAMAVGWRGAFITRPGMVVNPAFPAPDITGPDLGAVATALIDEPG